MCCHANTVHLHLFHTQTVSVIEFADFLSCKVPGVFAAAAAAAWPRLLQTTLDHTSNDLTLWSNSHEVNSTLKILVLECFAAHFLPAAEWEKASCGVLPPPPLPEHSPHIATTPGACRKSHFQAKPSQFVPLVFSPRCLQTKTHPPSACGRWCFYFR